MPGLVVVGQCEPTLLANLAVPESPNSNGRTLGTESEEAHAIVRAITGVRVAPTVRFYTTQLGRIAPHKDRPAFNPGVTETLIIYLSDYDGGDLYFETGEAVRTARGVTVRFDKGIVHWTDPVVDGIKRCVVCDVVPDP